MKTHEMRLHEGPFLKIESGLKCVELRLFDEKRRQIDPGDEILFQLRGEEARTVRARVTALFRYPAFADLAADLPAAWMGYESSEDLLESLNRMDIYTPEEIAKYGVLGIKIERL